MPKDNKNKKEKKHFFKDFKAELKKVIWPTSKQLVNNTIAVITIVVIIAAIVFVLDFVFEKANTLGVNGLKSIVESSNSVDGEETSEDENVDEEENETQQSEESENSEEVE